MQEQRRLQHPGDDVAPVDRPVEVVQLAGVLERIRDERDQAENVEMRGAWRRPAAQQNVNTDAQINQGNQPQRIVQGAVGRNQNDVGIERHRIADQRISSLRPNAGAVKLPLQSRGAS